ncbi:uncharacterized protein LOC141863734 [Acropora palmata]|uniref:uncharacterized protein LOC141863734 n=1 Tax=Acropora palmata TaxID=6131 RepID=UPI003DA00B7A
MASAASSGLCHLDMTDNEKCWLVFGIALNKVLIPQIRPFVDQEVIKEYNTLKTSHSIDSQSATSRLREWPGTLRLKYENINGNNRLPRLGGKYDFCNFNCQVFMHTDFAKLYLESYMIHFNAFDDHLDASAVLLLLGRVPAFPGTVQAAANSVRNERNDWAHCVFSKWNEAKFQHSFAEMEDLVKAMALPSSHEGKIVGQLKDWQNKGIQLCMNSPVDQALLQLVHQNIHSLENDVKNWSEELKEEKEKVQQQLQTFGIAFKEIKQRLLKLETGHRRLESEQQRLETEQRRLETSHLRTETEQQRLKTGHQRLETEQQGLKNGHRGLETEQQRLKTGHQRLETEQQRLTTGHQELETEQQRLKTGHQRLGKELQRLESDHKKLKTEQQRLQSDVEERVIKCEDEISDLKEKRLQQESHTVANPERFVQLIRRDYKSAMLCPFPWCEDELQFKLANIFTRLQIVSKTRERSKLTDEVVNMTDVFRPHAECENPRVVLVEGNPAMGKTTYSQKLAHDWSLGRIPEDSCFPRVEMLLLLKCRDMNVLGLADIEQAIDDQLLPQDIDRSEKEDFFHFIRANQSRILLVLDGLDELNDNLFQELIPLIQGKVLSNIYLLLTARLEMGAKVRRHCDSLLQIVGYSKDDAISYIDQYFRNHSDPSLAQKLKNKLADDQQLKELTTSPMNTALLCLLCEETNGKFPTTQTEMYECLVSCAIRRYYAKRGVDLDGEDPSERYRDQLNHLGKMAFEAFLENRVYFSREEMKSEDFLQLCFVAREPSRSKLKPTQSYAFSHKTFQEYFAALYLANEVLKDSKEGEELLLKVSPVDNWQVWKFLFPLVAKKDGERAVFLVSCLDASSRHAIPETNNDITSVRRTHDFDKAFHWALMLSERETLYNDVVRKALDTIASCEDYDEVLSDWQRKMLVKLAECIRLEKLIQDLENPCFLLAVAEYLRASCTLRKVQFITESCDLSKLGYLLQSLDKLVHFELNAFNGSSVGTFQSIRKLCPLLTHFDIRVQLSVEDIPVILDDVCTNQVLTHLRLRDTGIFDQGAISLAEGLQTNVSLTHLTLCDRSIKTVGLKGLAQALHTNHVLTHLDLTDSAISDEVAEALSEALRINTTLTHLNVSARPFAEGPIGPSGASALATALANNRTFNSLILAYNYIMDSGALAFADALQTNSTLTQLNLSWDGFGDSGTEAIFKALQSNHVITHLSLRGHTIGDSGAEALAAALQSPATQLSYLQLAGCKITSLGVEALAGALQTKRCLMHLTTELLSDISEGPVFLEKHPFSSSFSNFT